MNRRATFGWAVGSGCAIVTVLIGCGLNAWLRPDLSDASSAELKSESWALLDQSRTRPWYIGWAPAIRHAHLHEEMHRRGEHGLVTVPDATYAALGAAISSRGAE